MKITFARDSFDGLKEMIRGLKGMMVELRYDGQPIIAGTVVASSDTVVHIGIDHPKSGIERYCTVEIPYQHFDELYYF